MFLKDVEIFEYELGNGNKLAILRGGLESLNPIEYMNKITNQYVYGKGYTTQLIEKKLDNPWVRVVIIGLENLEYQDFDISFIRNRIIENVLVNL
jgi:hypothetical protein